MPRLSKIGAAALAAFGWTGLSSVTVSYLVVAGGGSGGTDHGGGGGAGGFLSGTTSLNPTESYTVTVGAGGASPAYTTAGNNGSNSVFGSITSTGGGCGGGGSHNAGNGGSGGGARPYSPYNVFGTGISGQGNNGGTSSSNETTHREGGGGGGASAVGQNSNLSTGAAGNGGAGSEYPTSSGIYYAGGGGGGCSAGFATGTGGTGGGGNGASGSSNGSNGTVNKGGGGGGSGGVSASAGGAGGSGIVIISYPSPQQFGGGVVTVSGGNTIHTFTTSGTLSPLNALTASYLVVAGGGGGGGHAAGGGGGAGGFLSGSSLTLDTNSIYTVSVGGGGSGGTTSSTNSATNGTNSSFSAVSTVAVGGGFGSGGNPGNAGATGGSGGGGGGFTFTLGTGTAGQGKNGGTGVNKLGAGGGGADTVGGSAVVTTNAGSGGNGLANPITGSTTGQLSGGIYYLAGGGGGGSHLNHPNGSGGLGGGGTGGAYANPGNGGVGTDNLGGGGGGAGGQDGINAAAGANGGSGVVIISYPGATQQMAGGTVTVAGGNVIHTFTSSGYLTPIVLVNNSLRFRASAGAWLNRTFGTPTLSTKWTWSGWFKLGSLTGTNKIIFDGGSPDTRLVLQDISNGPEQLIVGNDTTTFLATSAVYRDYSAWYHAVLAFDSSQGTASNRLRLYINGSEVTAFATDNRSSISGAIGINTATAHGIGKQPAGGVAYFDGYMADINFVDGQQLTPNSFGTLNGLGVWQPIRYGGSYGTNGFYLPFTNTTSTTTLGYDFSPNGNNWTTNNISLTSGSTYDSMTDVPTLTSATTANYCVINPLANSGIGTLSRGNLQLVTSTNSKTITGTLALPSTGQYYWEITATDYITDNGTFFGVVNQSFLTGAPSNGTWLGFNTYSATYNNGTSTDTNGLTGANVTNDGDIWCIAVDVTNNKFWIGRSRAGTLVWADGVTPAVNGSGATTLSLPSGDLYPMAYRGGSDNETYNFNFGQQPFAQTPPTGFVALNTFNLPTPTIGATASTTANKYFDATLYTGTGSTQNITNSGSMQPDWVWIKNRSSTNSHQLTDSVRGVNLALASDLTIDEFTGNINAFNTNGFQLTGATNAVNASGQTYVGWQWRASGSTTNITVGQYSTSPNVPSIASTVSANTTAGFSIVTYSANGSTGTVGHGLGVVPSMIIVKKRNAAERWCVFHTSTSNAYIYLDETFAAETTNANVRFGNNTVVVQPTSTVFTIGSSNDVNGTSGTYVAYCFAQIAGYSAFGTYTGNGSPDGTFVYTGFRPRFVMVKCSSNTTASTVWVIFDTSRSPYNAAVLELYPDDSASEGTDSSGMDILSNGFKPKRNSEYLNLSGWTYIYAAFAESPFKYANAR